MHIKEKPKNSIVALTETRPAEPITIMSDIHGDGLLRLVQIIGTTGARQSKSTSKAKGPFYHPIFPVSRSKFYAGIRQGIYPAPIKYGRSSLWRSRDILALLQGSQDKT